MPDTTNTQPPNRYRANSREIPNTYAGQFGAGGELNKQTDFSDLLPFELSLNRNTDWLKTTSSFSLLFTYVFFIGLIEFLLSLPILNIKFESSWTITNVLHGVISLFFLHWIKGSPNWYEQGELSAMTTWEQIITSPDSNSVKHVKTVMFVVPTLLCYLACFFANYDKTLSAINCLAWAISILAKLDSMVGVRIGGINTTIGIDDDTAGKKKL